jgi:predicted O-methyltransferase YrrM
MPLGAWLDLPQNLWRRATERDSTLPWMVPAAVRYLHRLIRPDWCVLEFGSGASTTWYAMRARWVMSLEHDAGWFQAVRQKLEQANLCNAEVRHIQINEYADFARGLEDASLDLVIVDGIDSDAASRVDCIAAIRPKVRPLGYIVLDDSDNARYLPVEILLGGWPVKRFQGMKPFPLVATETSIYQRPLERSGANARDLPH